MKNIILEHFVYIPMPIIWIILLYFIVKSNFWKKFFLYTGFIILLITSIPIVSNYIGKFFYSDNYRTSNHENKPAYVLIPTAGIWYDGYGDWHPTYESIRRTQYGKELSKRMSIPLILAGGGLIEEEGIKKVKEAKIISKYFDYDFYILELESKNTYEMAKNLRKLVDVSDGSLLLATNPLHHKRTILVLKKQNFDVSIPDDYLKNIRIGKSFIPSIYGFKSFNNIVYEFLGIVWYYFTGKI